MSHGMSADDRKFRRAFEACETPPEQFNHRAHLRLAYVYLCGSSVDAAHRLMKRSLLAYLDHLGAGTSKYHETMTRSWIMAVAHFMDRCPPCQSAGEFLQRNPKLLDAGIMLTHYSKDALFSEQARERFVEPDRQPIPSQGRETQGSSG